MIIKLFNMSDKAYFSDVLRNGQSYMGVARNMMHSHSIMYII